MDEERGQCIELMRETEKMGNLTGKHRERENLAEGRNV